MLINVKQGFEENTLLLNSYMSASVTIANKSRALLISRRDNAPRSCDLNVINLLSARNRHCRNRNATLTDLYGDNYRFLYLRNRLNSIHLRARIHWLCVLYRSTSGTSIRKNIVAFLNSAILLFWRYGSLIFISLKILITGLLSYTNCFCILKFRIWMF